MYGGNRTLKARGALSIGVPGEIAGLYAAWKDHGKLSWKSLVTPAAKLAEAFTISPYLQMQMEATRAGILANAGIRAVYAPNGDILKVNDTCHNVALARTLKAVAARGPDAFYTGPVASQLVKDVREVGGIMTTDDLENYQVKVRRPLSESVMGLTVLTMPPPSAGGAGIMLVSFQRTSSSSSLSSHFPRKTERSDGDHFVCVINYLDTRLYLLNEQVLNILSQYGISGFSGSLGIHRLIESLKHYMAIRMNLGDPDFVDVSEVVADMVSPEFAAELKRTIYDNMTFPPQYYGGR
jgi:gamma-glutamyltranspeptidase/glutathione hydrolase/leukotriene-C4 hydrolase